MTLREHYYAYSNYINGYSSSIGVPSTSIASCENEAKEVSIPALPTEESTKLKWHEEFKQLIVDGQKKGLLKNAIVHGSFGDLTFTNYSDFDVTLHIPTGVVQSLEETKRLRLWVIKRLFPFMLSVDPLQHHGPFVLWDSLIESYSEKILPICAYEHCWSVYETNIEFKPLLTDEPENQTWLSLITCDALMDASNRFFKSGYNMFSIKRYLSNLMLVPAFYYTDINQPTLKAASFEPFYQKFGPASLAVQHASRMRENWPRTPWWIKKGAAISGVFQKRAMPHKFTRLSYSNPAVKSELLNEVIPAISMLRRAIRDAIDCNE